MILRRYIAVLFALCLLKGVSDGQADPSYDEAGFSSCENAGLGYLAAPSMSPGHILRPSSLFVMPKVGTKGTERVDLDFHWANVWNYVPNQYMIDGEWIRSTVRYSYAVKDDVSLGLALPFIGRTGGIADSSIENFHKAFTMGNADRDKFPRNQSRITVTDGKTVHTVAEGESWGIGDVSFFAVSRLTEGSWVWPAVIVQGEVFMPTGNEDKLRGMGAPGIAVSSVASKRLGRSPFIAFLGLGIEYCNAEDIATIRIRDDQLSGLAGMEYQYSKSLSLLVQYLISSPAAKNYLELAEPTHEVSVGIKWRMSADNLLELAVVENVGLFQNSADIGVHLAFGWCL